MKKASAERKRKKSFVQTPSKPNEDTIAVLPEPELSEVTQIEVLEAVVNGEVSSSSNNSGFFKSNISY